MKRALIAIVLVNLAGAGMTHAEDIPAADTLVWCGLDYSMVKMIGTGDFRKPENIFPEMLVKWNSLFMKEMLPELEGMARSAVTDLKAVEARNEKASANQIAHEDGTRDEMGNHSHITEANIADG